VSEDVAFRWMGKLGVVRCMRPVLGDESPSRVSVVRSGPAIETRPYACSCGWKGALGQLVHRATRTLCPACQRTKGLRRVGA